MTRRVVGWVPEFDHETQRHFQGIRPVVVVGNRKAVELGEIKEVTLGRRPQQRFSVLVEAQRRFCDKFVSP